MPVADLSSISQDLAEVLGDQVGKAEAILDDRLPVLNRELWTLQPGKTDQHQSDLKEFSEGITERIMDLQQTIRKKVDRTSATPTSRATSPEQRERKVNTSHLPRLEPLRFSGKVEEYPEFKRNWIARFGDLGNDVQLQYLKPSLPPKDQSKVGSG